jgi:hypothetical protein
VGLLGDRQIVGDGTIRMSVPCKMKKADGRTSNLQDVDGFENRIEHIRTAELNGSVCDGVELFGSSS